MSDSMWPVPKEQTTYHLGYLDTPVAIEDLIASSDEHIDRVIIPWVECADGYTFGVQASASHACTPACIWDQIEDEKILTRGYTTLEVELPHDAGPLPPGWAFYETDTAFDDRRLYQFVPTTMVRDLITYHGGQVLPVGYVRGVPLLKRHKNLHGTTADNAVVF